MTPVTTVQQQHTRQPLVMLNNNQHHSVTRQSSDTDWGEEDENDLAEMARAADLVETEYLSSQASAAPPPPAPKAPAAIQRVSNNNFSSVLPKQGVMAHYPRPNFQTPGMAGPRQPTQHGLISSQGPGFSQQPRIGNYPNQQRGPRPNAPVNGYSQQNAARFPGGIAPGGLTFSQQGAVNVDLLKRENAELKKLVSLFVF